MAEEDKRSLWGLFLWGSNSISRTLMAYSPPKDSISTCPYIGDKVTTSEFWRDTNIQAIAMILFCLMS
jgi:hypothetical protein